MTVTVKTFAATGEAAQALAMDAGARFLGGGTFIMRGVNEGRQDITSIIMSSDAALTQVRPAGGHVEIGARVTMAGVLASSDLAFLHPAARVVGGPAIRNMASVGGNLFARAPYGDFTVALLALDAKVTLAGGSGTREMPLEAFLEGFGRASQGIVASVSVARPSSPDALRFVKVSRVRPKGASVITIAAHLPLSGGRVSGARVAYGAMAERPMRVPAVERALEGAALDEQGVAAAVAAACEGCAPPTDSLASQWYRRAVAPVHLKRLLLGRHG
jgi:CO/xanthine dehydrogenase FAD-binding subunit